MKVTQVAIRPTEASNAAGRPALTPELLAASGARYSRNSEGLDAILDKINPNNLDRSVDSIFRMIDYGHQSIADMVTVCMFIDGISIWLAYYIWSLCPTAGGQESSTRYIKFSLDELIGPEPLGISAEDAEEWVALMGECFQSLEQSLEIWERIAAQSPEVTRVPQSLLNDTSDRAMKQVARMKRNYGFDRARYFLPVAASTNLMLIMSARAWVQLCQYLLSHDLPESQRVGEAIRRELELCAPRMLKHATTKSSVVSGLRSEFNALLKRAKRQDSGCLEPGAATFEHLPTPSLQVMLPCSIELESLAADLSFHDNRYAWIGDQIRRTGIRFAWDAVAFAEIRDLNRHRTGNKYCPLVPNGFYSALDQLPESQLHVRELHECLKRLSDVGRRASAVALSRLRAGDPGYIYWTVLGTQYPFEHITTADKFVYEAELRTGTGAHFRYAKHLHDVLSLWYEQFPNTRGMILEGSAEPE